MGTEKRFTSVEPEEKRRLKDLESLTKKAFEEMTHSITEWKQADPEDVDKYFLAVNKLKAALVLAETLELEIGMANGTIKFN